MFLAKGKKAKVKVTLEQATKAQWGSRGIEYKDKITNKDKIYVRIRTKLPIRTKFTYV